MYGPYLMPLVVSLAVLRVVPASLENCVMWFQNPVTGGSRSACWSRYRAIWLRSVWAVVCTFERRASLLAELNCGMTIAARMPRMITTIRISIRVKPDLRARLLRIAVIAMLLLLRRVHFRGTPGRQLFHLPSLWHAHTVRGTRRTVSRTSPGACARCGRGVTIAAALLLRRLGGCPPAPF